MMLTKLVRRKSCLGEENKRDQFLVCAKRTETKFDLTKAVLPMKLSSPGCTTVTSKFETFFVYEYTRAEWLSVGGKNPQILPLSEKSIKSTKTTSDKSCQSVQCRHERIIESHRLLCEQRDSPTYQRSV